MTSPKPPIKQLDPHSDVIGPGTCLDKPEKPAGDISGLFNEWVDELFGNLSPEEFKQHWDNLAKGMKRK